MTAAPSRAIVSLWAGLALGACRSPAANTAADAAADGSTEQSFIVEYDLGAAFSIVDNPNGPWRYGHTRSAALAADDVELDAFAADSTPVRFWHPTDAVYYPYIAHNQAQATVADPTDSWAVRAHEVAMEGSQDGQYSVVQFVAPRGGMYEIQADFTAIHFRLSSTDVHVLHGNAAAFDAQLDGYGGDPAFHGIEGQSPRAGYHEVRAVAAGDILTFAVGIGQNGTYFNDTTGLFVHLSAHD